MATTRTRSPFDQPGLAWQCRRRVNDKGDEMYSPDTIMLTPDEDLFDEAYESCSDSDTEDDEQAFDNVTPNVVSQHSIAFGRYMEIRSDVAKVASKIEDYNAVVDACYAGKLKGMLSDEGTLTPDGKIMMYNLSRFNAILLQRVILEMVNVLETLQEDRKYEDFMEWWASASGVRENLRMTEDAVDCSGKALKNGRYLDRFHDLGLKVNRYILKRFFRFSDFRDNEEYRNTEVETLKEKVWLDMVERVPEDRLAKGYLTDEDEEIFWDLKEDREEFKDRGSWVVDLLDQIEHQKVAVRTSLWRWPGDNDADALR